MLASIVFLSVSITTPALPVCFTVGFEVYVRFVDSSNSKKIEVAARLVCRGDVFCGERHRRQQQRVCWFPHVYLSVGAPGMQALVYLTRMHRCVRSLLRFLPRYEQLETIGLSCGTAVTLSAPENLDDGSGSFVERTVRLGAPLVSCLFVLLLWVRIPSRDEYCFVFLSWLRLRWKKHAHLHKTCTSSPLVRTLSCDPFPVWRMARRLWLPVDRIWRRSLVSRHCPRCVAPFPSPSPAFSVFMPLCAFVLLTTPLVWLVI